MIDYIDLSKCTISELEYMHYYNELQFAKEILGKQPFSDERKELLKLAHEQTHTIMQVVANKKGISFKLGSGDKSILLISKAIKHYKKKHNGIVNFFEGGIGTGKVLKEILKLENVKVYGCDVYLNPIEDVSNATLYTGTVYEVLKSIDNESINVFYWNDVFEHIPKDEIEQYIDLIYNKLSNDGIMITITPNWHLRPSDVTSKFEPRGTEAKGLHFKEYTYREMTDILIKHRFKNIKSPICYNPIKKQYACVSNVFGSIVHNIKMRCESLNSILPYKLKRIVIFGFGYNTTIAQK